MDLNIIEMTNDEVKNVTEGIYATRNGTRFGVVDTIHNLVLDQAGDKAVYRDKYAIFTTGDDIQIVFFETQNIRKFRGKTKDYSDKSDITERSSINYRVIEIVSNNKRYILNAITGEDLIVCGEKDEWAYRPSDKILYSAKVSGEMRAVNHSIIAGKLEDLLNKEYKSVRKLTGKIKGYDVICKDGKETRLTSFGQLY